MNRNTVKVSYSTTPNVAKFISGRNAKLLASEKQVQDKKCSCRKNTACPLDGKCLEENIVYHAEVSQLGNNTRNYVGLCSTDFKSRLGVHKHSFKFEEENQTSLSKYIWKLKNKNIDYNLRWRIVDRGTPYNPTTKTCTLCIREKFYILYHPRISDLNSKTEIYANCRHKQRILLSKKVRRKRKSPGN